MSIYSAFFAAYNASVQAGNRLSREEQISTFTGGRTESLKDLSAQELQQLTALLQQSAPPQKPKERSPEEIKADKMRKAIISIFYKMGHNVATAKAWAEKQGVRGVKKPFNDYTTDELFVLIRVAEKALADYQAAIRRAIANP